MSCKREEEVKALCAENGLACEIKFGAAFVRSKYESFFFDIYEEGQSVRLMHMDSRINKKSDYHIQLEGVVSLKDLIEYIRMHGEAKYTTKFIKFPQPIIDMAGKRYKKSFFPYREECDL